MTTYISILRGINVSGKNMIKMNALQEAFINAGFNYVTTYIQSGNIVFQSKKDKTKNIETKIYALIKTVFGLDVPVLVQEAEELKNIIQKNPFINDVTKDAAFMHITFLSGTPDNLVIEKIKENDYYNDEFISISKTVYLYCPNGYGNSKLTNSFWENKLKLVATTRNWKTVNELLNIASKLNP